MIVSDYSLHSYTEYLHQLAAAFGTTVHNNRIDLPPNVGIGYFQLLLFDDGPETLLYDFTLKDTLVLHRATNDSEYYTLVLDDFADEEGFHVKIDADEVSDPMERSTAFYLSSFLYDVEIVVYKNVNVKGVRVLLTTNWMRQYLQLDQNEAVLGRYIDLKSAGIWYKPVTSEATMLLNELLQEQDIPLLFYRNKIFRFIQLFFEWLYDEMKVLSGKTGVSRQDVKTVQRIENRLTADVTILPPTLKELSREAAMSESKLKKIFKAVYGLPPYEYYQRQRMKQARLMLLSGNYSVKDIGYTLGYANLSNFTLAFKKVFNELPSQVVPK